MPTETNSAIKMTAQNLIGQGSNIASNFIDTTDPLSSDYQSKLAAKTSLQGLAMGSQFGLPGMIIGGLGGAAYGAIKADDLTAEAKKTKGINEAFDNYQKNQIENPITMQEKPIKALTQMQGTVAHNMSAKQYNENKKMNALAMNGIPAALTMIENPSEKQKAAFDHNNDDKVSKEELKTTFKS